MNNISVNLHNYCKNFVNLHNYTQTDISYFQAKWCKLYTFFYYTQTNVNALNSKDNFLVQLVK